MIRQPIVTVMGHVDHGKTMLLDRIRESDILGVEVGGITQHIGATEVPVDHINKQCSPLLKKFKIDLKIPGLLFIDTPGHAAFTNLRKRGGALADIAVLVIDISAGVQPQTLESLKILKHNKTPFIIALNKIDIISGWRAAKGGCFLDNFATQEEHVLQELDKKLYQLVVRLAQEGFDSERYDRIDDFTKQISIIPTSAKTGEGVSDLLAMLAGLSQRYLEDKLEIHESQPAKGTVLEVKKLKGIGTTADVIIYDGTLKVGDTFATMGVDAPIVSKVRALQKPLPLGEIRDPRNRFETVRQVTAAAGVRVIAPGLEEALSGSPFVVGEGAAGQVAAYVDEIEIHTEGVGIILKADTLGSLEAVAALLKEEKIPINSANIGRITKKDVVASEDMLQRDEMKAVVMGFNTKADEAVMRFAEEKGIKVITADVIYQLSEQYKKFVEEKKAEKIKKELEKLMRAAKFQILPGFIFRQSKPAVVGVELLLGTLRSGSGIMNENGDIIAHLKQIQQESKTVKELKKGKRGALSLVGPTVGRQIDEGDILYTVVPEKDFVKLKELEKLLNEDEKAALEEIARIMRKAKRSWGMVWG